MITTICGDNKYAAETYLSELIKEFIDKNGSAGVEKLDGESIDPAALTSLLGGVTLFAINRLVIIKSISGNKPASERLIDILDSVPDEVHLVLVETTIDKRTALYKSLRKQTDFHEFSPLSESELLSWVQQQAKKYQASINPAAARQLITAVSGDQLRLDSELVKLAAYNPSITAQIVDKLVAPDPTDSVFQLLDASLSGDRQRTAKLIANLEAAHQDPFQISNLLIWQINVLAIVSSVVTEPNQQIAKDHGINPYVISKTKNLAAKLSKDEISNIVEQVAGMDALLKSSSANPWNVLSSTLISVASQ